MMGGGGEEERAEKKNKKTKKNKNDFGIMFFQKHHSDKFRSDSRSRKGRKQ